MRIDAYSNLRNDCVSVKSREPEDYGKVVSHQPKVHVSDVEFVIQPAGQKRARETSVKNVHAFVRGKWDDSEKVVDGTEVVYDLFGVGAFVEADTGRVVEGADRVAVTKGAVYAKGLRYADDK